MRKALRRFFRGSGDGAAGGSSGEPAWHTWQEIDTAKRMPLARVLAALEGCTPCAVAGVHAASLAQFARAPFQTVAPQAPRALDAALGAVEALVLTDTAWTAVLLAEPALLKSVALKVKRKLIAPLRLAAEPLWARWGAGFYEPESARGHFWRWAGHRPGVDELLLRLELGEPRDGRLRFAVRWPPGSAAGTLALEHAGGRQHFELKSGARAELPLRLTPGENTLRFSTTGPEFRAPGDLRSLAFALTDLSWRSSDGGLLLERDRAYGVAPAVLDGAVRLSSAERELQAAGFWTVQVYGAARAESPDGALLRSSRGVQRPTTEVYGALPTTEPVWVFADRRDTPR